MKTKKRIILFLALLSLAALIAGGAYSYAKYFTRADGNIGSNIKRWNIKVNNESIKGKTTLTNHITATFPNENGHTKENKVAPGTEGYFEIVIDYEGVDVDFTYSLSISGDDVADISLTRLVADNVEIPATDVVTGSVTIDGITTSKTILAYVTWNDGAGSTLTNLQDTDIALTKTSADFDVEMSFVQSNT